MTDVVKQSLNQHRATMLMRPKYSGSDHLWNFSPRRAKGEHGTGRMIVKGYRRKRNSHISSAFGVIGVNFTFVP